MVLCSAMLMQDEAQWENLQPPYEKKNQLRYIVDLRIL